MSSQHCKNPFWFWFWSTLTFNLVIWFYNIFFWQNDWYILWRQSQIYMSGFHQYQYKGNLWLTPITTEEFVWGVAHSPLVHLIFRAVILIETPKGILAFNGALFAVILSVSMHLIHCPLSQMKCICYVITPFHEFKFNTAWRHMRVA